MSDNNASDEKSAEDDKPLSSSKESDFNESEFDAGSENFNPLSVLYAEDVRISRKPPKVQYQNIAAFESALKRFGVWGLQQKPNGAGTSQSQTRIVEEAKEVRRFLPHQMPIRSTMDNGIDQRRFKNFWRTMTEVQGPLRALSEGIAMQPRVRVVVRNERGVRGHVEGNVVCFDKHWNLLLKSVKEVWRRRKFKYGVNKACGAGTSMEDCTQRLADLGITLPEQTVRSLNRKNVEITRYLGTLMVRGEQVVLINIIRNESG